ncbi:MAG: phage tail protein [Anaerolineae bacterium]|nr:phage tail protein [Anaerolineae bacterium]
MEPFIGEIRMVAFTSFAPMGWAFCNGQILQIVQNQALFALIGNQYGGDGRTTFALPNLQGRVPVHIGPGFGAAQNGGEVAHTLTQAEIPAHTHAATATTTLHANSAAANSGTPTDAVMGNTGRDISIYQTGAANVNQGASAATTTVTVESSAGGGGAHNNLQPYQVVSFIIALQGIFPPRE